MHPDIEYCAATIRGGSRTFHAASLVFPRRYRDPALALYAFCRMADDAIDSSDDAPAALVELRNRLDRVYGRRPFADPADRAFAAVVEEFAVPRTLPEALLEGFQWDAEGRRYETFDDLVAYAVRVAGTVGAMMALLMGRREPAVIARAVELGVAMQLTNIARDVGEDARACRLYLPLSWLRDAGIEPGLFVARPVSGPQLAGVVQRLLYAAEAVYDRAEVGIAHLPAGCRPAISAARVLYAEIGRQVERNGLDSVSRRAVVPASRKAALAPAVGVLALAPTRSLSGPWLTQARFLIDAVAAARPPRVQHLAPSWWRLGARVVWVIDLFERLERRQRPSQSA
jgi:phytoene synthase